jgi:excisionase family DNA binding protein
MLADTLAPRVADAVAARTAPVGDAEEWHLLDVGEAAARLGRSTRWVRERVKRGDLPFVKLDGGALCFELTDLQEFAQSKRVPLADRLQRSRNPALGLALRGADRVDNRRVNNG